MKKTKVLILLSLFIIFLIVSIVCFSMSFEGYSIFALTVSIIFGVFGVRQYLQGKNPKQAYENEIKDILNTYDSILLKCNSVPNFDDRNIIIVESMDDLVDAQFEIRKPICFLKQTDNCSFMLLDEKEVYVYISKLNEEEPTPVEIEIQNMKYRQKANTDMDSEMLRDIDKTTIVKLSNKKSYRISPIRKKEAEVKPDVNQTAVEQNYSINQEELQEVAPPVIIDEVEILDL
ncbi:MAG: hypothetical protein IKF71_01310 [Bacilli bacterium]|nr:hypothetical protein [Bacilli bacterium]